MFDARSFARRAFDARAWLFALGAVPPTESSTSYSADGGSGGGHISISDLLKRGARLPAPVVARSRKQREEELLLLMHIF